MTEPKKPAAKRAAPKAKTAPVVTPEAEAETSVPAVTTARTTIEAAVDAIEEALDAQPTTPEEAPAPPAPKPDATFALGDRVLIVANGDTLTPEEKGAWRRLTHLPLPLSRAIDLPAEAQVIEEDSERWSRADDLILRVALVEDGYPLYVRPSQIEADQ